MQKLIIALLCLQATTAFAQSSPRPDADPRIEGLTAAVSELRLREIVGTLAAFGTRHTLSDTTSSTKGIGAARQWILAELRRTSPKLQVTFDTHNIAQQAAITRAQDVVNVMAVLAGRSPRRIYVTAHYDTVSTGPLGAHAANTRPVGEPAPPDAQLRPDQDYNVPAPGANDNGSG